MHRCRVEPAVGLHRTFDGAGGEPLLESEVARLVDALGKGVPRCGSHEVAHKAEGCLDAGLQVGCVLATKAGLRQENVALLCERRRP